MDTPGVDFSLKDRLEIVRTLDSLGVPEAEVVAPARVETDLAFAERMREQELRIALSGLIYANRAGCTAQGRAASKTLDRIDLLMPLSREREPPEVAEKISMMTTALQGMRACDADVGVGFPHASQVDPAIVIDAAAAGAEAGASRVIVYDTNGSAEPFGVYALIAEIVAAVTVPVHFHGHNDLGLAVANSWAAIKAGATGLDVTLNGLGDRAGNASLEQIAVVLHLHGVETGIAVEKLPQACRLIERLSGISISKLAPVIGDFAFDHRSPSHLGIPTEFEAFAPSLVGGSRRKES